MLTDKQLKEKYKPEFWKNYEKYYPVKTLKEEGFHRNICEKCKKPFWNVDKNRKVCGDPSCSKEESFGFIGKSPAKNYLSYEDVWNKFSKLFQGLGYKAIQRYPIVSRWNPIMEYTNASIAAFQPYVVSGEVKAPAKKLVIPQFCFRTVDIDNVGISGAHMTVFNMIGQHGFFDKKEWNQNEVFKDIHSWLKKGLGLDNKEITFHEDAWAGGGNLGCCMEFFSRGCELGNQVYMLYEQTATGIRDLKLKVLDMGLGMERNAWFAQGANTIYDASFPVVLNKLMKITGLKHDKNIIKKYVPYAGLLNIDEIDDINKAWNDVSEKVKVEVEELKENVLPLAALYSIAEHSRALLIMLNDGALPSNTGDSYNLRVMLRRALSFIDKSDWDIYLPEVCEWHSKELKIFPELKDNLEDVRKILDVEKNKYENTKQKSKSIIANVVNKGINEDELLKLYDSHGITPELIKEEAEKQGKKVKIPEDFYKKVSEMHEKKEQKHAMKQDELNLEDVKDTEVLYYDDYEKVKFKAKVLKVMGKNVVLDKTYFYPTSGGQVNDTGIIAGEKVVDVFKQGNKVVHVLKEKHEFKEGENVYCEIDKERRKQLAQHHTTAHIINYAARKVLGNHVNQAGAFKDVRKGHLDITHYSSLTDEEIRKIEEEANNVVKENIPIRQKFMKRDEAEKNYGFRIYQGPAVPGNNLRIVEIPEIDIECCGGTHLKNTSEVGKIKILKSSKVSDAVLRIEYVSGIKEIEAGEMDKEVLERLSELLDCEIEEIPGRCKELFEKWKNIVKKKRNEDKTLKSKEKFNGDVLLEAAKILKTQPEHVEKTVRRFLEEIRRYN